ncbi:GlyGly-CTERM sorting domain-containing protein [Flavobacterium sp.]
MNWFALFYLFLLFRRRRNHVTLITLCDFSCVEMTKLKIY